MRVGLKFLVVASVACLSAHAAVIDFSEPKNGSAIFGNVVSFVIAVTDEQGTHLNRPQSICVTCLCKILAFQGCMRIAEYSLASITRYVHWVRLPVDDEYKSAYK